MGFGICLNNIKKNKQVSYSFYPFFIPSFCGYSPIMAFLLSTTSCNNGWVHNFFYRCFVLDKKYKRPRGNTL